MVSASSNNKRVFISYSHKDKKDLDRLRTHLVPSIRSEALDVWENSSIAIGDKWRKEIEEALQQANIAILLVSADFLASQFIAENELPPLLAAAERGGVKIMSVILSPCDFDCTELAKYQAINSPSKPLSSMNSHKKEELWNKLVKTITKVEDPKEDKYKSQIFSVSYGLRPSVATIRTENQFILLRARIGAIAPYMLNIVKAVLEDIERISSRLIVDTTMQKRKISFLLNKREYLMLRGVSFDNKHGGLTLYIDLIHDKTVQPILTEDQIREEFLHGVVGEEDNGLEIYVEPCVLEENTGADGFNLLNEEYYKRLFWYNNI